MKILLLSIAFGFIFKATATYSQMKGGSPYDASSTRSPNTSSFMNGNYNSGMSIQNNFDRIIKNITVKNNLDMPGIIFYKSFQILIMIPQNNNLENVNNVILNRILLKRYSR